MIGVVAAMDEERDAFLEFMTDVKDIEEDNIIYHVGKIADKDVVLVKSGVGKVACAVVLTCFIMKFRPELVINTGSAGSLNRNVHVGDVVLATKVAYHDVDVFGDNWIPSFDNENSIVFFADTKLTKLFDTIKGDHVHVGDMVSGDSFIYRDDQIRNILDHFPTTLCGEMESGSVAQTCRFFNIPWMIVRSISDDTFAKNNESDFALGLENASKNSAYISKQIIEVY